MSFCDEKNVIIHIPAAAAASFGLLLHRRCRRSRCRCRSRSSRRRRQRDYPGSRVSARVQVGYLSGGAVRRPVSPSHGESSSFLWHFTAKGSTRRFSFSDGLGLSLGDGLIHWTLTLSDRL
jgi:hypothetical protein